MGLFGLATLAVVRRTREIGIRKVMGASVGNIVSLVSREFVLLVVIASVIAFPLAWWFLSDWLKDFAYRVHISWWIYLIAAIAAMLIALFTVSLQAIRAAIMNPVNSLRTEWIPSKSQTTNLKSQISIKWQFTIKFQISNIKYQILNFQIAATWKNLLY